MFAISDSELVPSRYPSVIVPIWTNMGVNAKTDKASVGQQAAGIEKHPERRFKAAFEAYQERELPVLKEEDLLYKMFQKSPDNPFNQTLVSYDATKSEKVEALTKRKKELEERLRETD
ncbi:coiled-coil protein, putative, partial [Rhizoctonia solani AG-3 Rhs1AP]